ncbi:hypothetical protein FRZ06_17735 [Anoxybacterium hadale]|uniref:Uncharacterized protein n=1 Tax=Anoxybacterium hadale TaxID=3408580 RepID=A0ACD1AFR7_9FIRM|nr:hypothetical protein FRZ06_17735 [Clostridiales bacterium]
MIGMKHRIRIRDRVLTLILSLLLFLSLPLLSPQSVNAASGFWDISGHWSEFYVKKVNNANVISGYPDGGFQPDKAVTRAEFISMVNRTYELNRLDIADTSTLSDVPYSSWYYKDVTLAVSAGYAGGYNDGTFRPNNPITRQEAAVMLDRLIPNGKKAGSLKSYPDSKQLQSWAAAAFSKLNGKGYMGPYSDNKLHPADPLTRAQTAKILSDILDNEDIVTRRTIVDQDKTTLAGKTFVGDVRIDEDLEEGSATIDNCIILGDLIINGGSTITLNNTRVVKAEADKDDTQVRIATKGNTTISNLELYGKSYIQTTGKDGQGTPKVIIHGSADATLKGVFPKVSIEGSRAILNLESGKVLDLQVTDDGRYSDIVLSGKAEITQATVDNECYFHGTGTVAYMIVNADGVTYETKPGKMTVGLKTDRPQEGGDEDVDVAFKPKNKANDVDVETEITITFNTSMKLAGGKEISDSSVGNFITLAKGSKTGDKVPFKAAINSAKKIITITPSQKLLTGTRYYVVLAEETLINGGGNLNDGRSVYFTTEGLAPEETAATPALGGLTLTPSDSSITVSFMPNSTGTVYAIAKTSPEALTVSQIRSGGKSTSVKYNTAGTLTLTGLSANTKYYVSAFLRNAYSTDSAIVTANTTTTMPEAALSSLTLKTSSGSNLLTGFKAETKTYDVQVPAGTAAVDVAAATNTTTNTNAVITINGETVNSKTGIVVTAGSTTKITVNISADNKKAVDYVINVTVAAQ